VQSAKVDIRASAPVNSVLIEWDSVAGVELAGGGQLRAPIVVSAMDAQRSFMESVGPAALDIEFQRALTSPKPRIASARLHLLLKGAPGDDNTQSSMKRRLVYAPSAAAQRKAFIEARAGRIPDRVMVEAIFPDALEDKSGAGDRQIISIFAHPLPFDAQPDDKRREHIENVIVASLENIAPGIAARIEKSDLRLPADCEKETGAAKGALAAHARCRPRAILAACFSAVPKHRLALDFRARQAGRRRRRRFPGGGKGAARDLSRRRSFR
jgi:phytoene dehydrogenase-like protein